MLRAASFYGKEALNYSIKRKKQVCSGITRSLGNGSARLQLHHRAHRDESSTPRIDHRSAGHSNGQSVRAPPEPGTASNVDFENLTFGYSDTRCNLRYAWYDGEWDLEPAIRTDPNVTIHTMSAGLQYGQGLFEGAKAHHCADGSVCLWNIQENAKRLNQGAARMLMPQVDPEMFREAVHRLVANNIEYVPPYGSGGALYIRPFMFGTGPQIGLGPAPAYQLCFVAMPVGPYYRNGLESIDACVLDQYSRASIGGVGNVKASGNYGADIKPSIEAKARGFPISLYLDSASQRYIEEFNVSNFIGISADRSTFVTPDSSTVLPSITNRMLQRIAEELGMRVERRPIEIGECADFSEVAGCGTAVVLAPLRRLVHGAREYCFEEPVMIKRLYERFRQIQVAEYPDRFGWLDKVDPRLREQLPSDPAKVVPLRLLTAHAGLGG